MNAPAQVAAGILIYMALVDLIAADVFSTHMREQRTWFQVGCLTALFLGAAAMVRLLLSSSSSGQRNIPAAAPYRVPIAAASLLYFPIKCRDLTILFAAL